MSCFPSITQSNISRAAELPAARPAASPATPRRSTAARRPEAADWFEDDGGKQAPPMGVTGMERERERGAGWPAALKCARDRVIAEGVRADSH